MKGGNQMAAHFGHKDRQGQDKRDQEGALQGRRLVASFRGRIVLRDSRGVTQLGHGLGQFVGRQAGGMEDAGGSGQQVDLGFFNARAVDSTRDTCPEQEAQFIPSMLGWW